ncbi:MAG: hypothetical protein FWD19_02715 [Defluviitaleaceae bacterium]|nr:hypothetical protein [Defluviitaleaceae bacterium]
MLAIAIGPKFAGAGGIWTVTFGVVVVVVPVVPVTLIGTAKLEALNWSLDEFAKMETVVVLLGATVTDQSFPETLEPCTRTPSTIAKTNCVSDVVRTEKVTVWPEEIVVRSMFTLVKAGTALTANGTAAISNTAETAATIVLMKFLLNFETKNIISFLKYNLTNTRI